MQQLKAPRETLVLLGTLIEATKAYSDLTMEALLPSCSFYILLLKQIAKARTVLRGKKLDFIFQ